MLIFFANTQADLRPPVVRVVAGVVDVAENEQTHVVTTKIFYKFLQYSKFQSICYNLHRPVCLPLGL